MLPATAGRPRRRWRIRAECRLYGGNSTVGALHTRLSLNSDPAGAARRIGGRVGATAPHAGIRRMAGRLHQAVTRATTVPQPDDDRTRIGPGSDRNRTKNRARLPSYEGRNRKILGLYPYFGIWSRIKWTRRVRLTYSCSLRSPHTHAFILRSALRAWAGFPGSRKANGNRSNIGTVIAGVSSTTLDRQ
jgi:hypothetical protein